MREHSARGQASHVMLLHRWLQPQPLRSIPRTKLHKPFGWPMHMIAAFLQARSAHQQAVRHALRHTPHLRRYDHVEGAHPAR